MSTYTCSQICTALNAAFDFELDRKYYQPKELNKNGEVLIVTLRRKPNRFEQKCLVRSALLFYAALLSFIHLNVLSNPPEDSLL